MGYQRNIRLLYCIIFLQSLMPAYAVERLFWQSRGISVQGVVVCEILYALTIVLLEVPSGVLADVIGRKTLLLIGAVMSCLEFFLLLFAQRFWHFGLVVVLTGIGGACVSGAWNALLYDSLVVMGREDRFERLTGRIMAMEAVGVVLAGFLGGFLGDRFGYSLTYWVSLGSCMLALCVTVWLAEPPRTQTVAGSAREAARTVLRRARDFFHAQPGALAVLVHATSFAAVIVYVDEFWQLYLDAVGFRVLLFGVVIAVFALARSGGALAADWLRQRVRLDRLLIGLSLLTACGIGLAAAVQSVWGLFAMFVSCGATEAMQVVAMGYVHRRADERARATIESIGSLLQRVVGMGVGALFASVTRHASLFSGFWALAIVSAGLVLGAAFMYRKGIINDQSDCSSHQGDHS